MSNSIIEVGSIASLSIDGNLFHDCVIEHANERSIIVRGFNHTTLPIPVVGSTVKLQAGRHTLQGCVTFGTSLRWGIRDISAWDTDRRGAVRHDCEARLSVTYGDKYTGGERSIQATMVNISASGLLFCCSESALSIGSVVTVVCGEKLHGIGGLKFVCEVARTAGSNNSYYYGCKFVEIEDRAQDALLKLLSVLTKSR